MNKTSKYIFRTGLLTALGLTAYFFIIKILGLNYVEEAHYANLLIVFFGVFFTLRYLNRKKKKQEYLEALGIGIVTSFVSALIFNVFLGVYLSYLDERFMENITRHAPLGHYMSPWQIAFVMFTEESSGGIILSLIAIQLFDGKRKENEQVKK